MKETDTIKDLEDQAKNTKYLMDRLNRALYGRTMDETVKILGGNHDGGKDREKDAE